MKQHARTLFFYLCKHFFSDSFSEVLGQQHRVTLHKASIHNLIDILINNLIDILIDNLIDMWQPSFRVTLRLQDDVAEDG